MKHPGRALLVAELIRTHGPSEAIRLVREADAKHREMFPDGCTAHDCPVCVVAPRDKEQG